MTNSVLKLGFAGTPELASSVLESLLENSVHEIKIVYTQPDRPAGRGRKIITSPVKQIALGNQLQLLQPEKPSQMNINNGLTELDVLIVVAYGMILPEEILECPRFGCLNIHTSLLPKWRGAAPVQRALQAGDSKTGVSIIQMDKGLDTGPVLARKECSIDSGETSASLFRKLAPIGASCLLEVLDKIIRNDVQPMAQDHSQATYANKIIKAEAKLDWNKSAMELERTVRAFNPTPVAYTEFNHVSIRVWEASVINQISNLEPGTIIKYDEQGIDVVTGNKIIRLLKIQPSGKRIMSVHDFYIGHPDFFKSHNLQNS